MRVAIWAFGAVLAFGSDAQAQVPSSPLGTLTAPQHLLAAKQQVDAFQMPCSNVVGVEVFDARHLKINCESGETYAVLVDGNRTHVAPWVSPQHLFQIEIDPAAYAAASARARSVPMPDAYGAAPPRGRNDGELGVDERPASVPTQGHWLVEVDRDEFAGTQKCKIVSADGRIEIFTDGLRNQMIGFKLTQPIVKPVYRVDGRGPQNFDYLVMSLPVRMYMQEQWARGVVMVPYLQVNGRRSISIRPSDQAVPETFDISGILVGLREGQKRGCLRIWLWNLG